jgi:hypothetical protein
MMIFRPEYGGLTYTLQVRVEAFNLILRLRFGQVRVMNSHDISGLGIDCKQWIVGVKCTEREGELPPPI